MVFEKSKKCLINKALPSLEEKRSTLPLGLNRHLNILRSPILSVDANDEDEEEKKEEIENGSQIGPHLFRDGERNHNEPGNIRT